MSCARSQGCSRKCRLIPDACSASVLSCESALNHCAGRNLHPQFVGPGEHLLTQQSAAEITKVREPEVDGRSGAGYGTRWFRGFETPSRGATCLPLWAFSTSADDRGKRDHLGAGLDRALLKISCIEAHAPAQVSCSCLDRLCASVCNRVLPASRLPSMEAQKSQTDKTRT